MKNIERESMLDKTAYIMAFKLNWLWNPCSLI